MLLLSSVDKSVAGSGAVGGFGAVPGVVGIVVARVAGSAVAGIRVDVGRLHLVGRCRSPD